MQEKNTEKLLSVLKQKRDTRIGLFKKLCEIENKIHDKKPPWDSALDAYVSIVAMSTELRNYLADMSVLDSKMEREVKLLSNYITASETVIIKDKDLDSSTWVWSDAVSKWKCVKCCWAVDEADADKNYEYCPHCGRKMVGEEDDRKTD